MLPGKSRVIRLNDLWSTTDRERDEMYIPVIPTAALAGFAAVAARYGLRKQWQNAAICLLSGFMAFLVIQGLTSSSPNLDQERRRINALERKVSTLENQLQRLQQPDDAK